MYITREKVLAVFEGYLKGQISKENVYKWADSIIRSKEFDGLKDKLLSEAIQALWELHHEGNEIIFDPTTEELEYYRDYLQGKVN